MTDNKYCVYEHWRTDTNSPFYIGKGTLARAKEFYRENEIHRRIVRKMRKTGFSVVMKIVLDGLSEETAFRLEKIRIAYWREVGVKLANFTDGGEGFSGGRHTEEAKKRIASGAKGRKLSAETLSAMSDSARIINADPERRKKLSQSTKAMWSDPQKRELMINSIRNAKKTPMSAEANQRRLDALRKYFANKPKKEKPIKPPRQKKTPPIKRPRSEFIESLRKRGLEEREKFMAYSHLGPKVLSRSVVCETDGRIFESASEAARFYNTSKSAIIELCLGNPRRKTVCGRLFAYEDAM